MAFIGSGREIPEGEELLISYVGSGGAGAAAAVATTVGRQIRRGKKAQQAHAPAQYAAGVSAGRRGGPGRVQAAAEGSLAAGREARRLRLLTTYLFDCSCSLCARGL